MNYLTYHFLNNKHNNGKLNCNFTFSTNPLSYPVKKWEVSFISFFTVVLTFTYFQQGDTLWPVTLFIVESVRVLHHKAQR